MRYELRLNAYDVMGVTHINARLTGTPDNPSWPTEQVWAKSGTCRVEGSPEATVWIREVLETMLAGL